MKKHIIKEGEWLSKIALEYKFKDGGEAIWKASPEIQKLSGGNRDVLAAGWELNIPDAQAKEAVKSSGAEHKFEVPAQKKNLRITLLEYDEKNPKGKPAPKWKYISPVGKPPNGVSDAKGEINLAEIPEDTKEIKINLGYTLSAFSEDITLKLGSLDPIIEGEIGLKFPDQQK